MKDIDIKELGIKIRQKKLRKPKLGYYNPKTLTIVINSDQSEVQKHSTLIHEFIGSGAICRIKIREHPFDMLLKQPARSPIRVEYVHGGRR